MQPRLQQHSGGQLVRSADDNAERAERRFADQLSLLGDERSVLAAEDILSESGMNLLGRGNAVNSRVLGRLLQHRLKRPIDHSVTIARAVNQETLSEIAGEALSNDLLAQALVNADEVGPLIELAFARLPLPLILRNKLTVMQRVAPQLLERSVLCAVLGVQMSRLSNAPPRHLPHVVYAGLLQDVGHLYLDTHALSTDQPIGAELRQQIREHPLISAQCLSDVRELPPTALRAIAEHHERCDGNGYPKGLLGDDISIPGRIISFVTFSLGAANRWGLEHLGHVIKIWLEGFDRRLIRSFWERCEVPTDGRHYPFAPGAGGPLGALLRDRETQWRALDVVSTDGPWGTIDSGLRSLQHALDRAGVGQLSETQLEAFLAEDHPETREACSVLIEGARQLNESCRQVEAIVLRDREPPLDEAPWEWVMETLNLTESLPPELLRKDAPAA